MKSSFISKLSAGVLFVAGVSILFAADQILPRLISGFPESATWLGELIGAGWLAMAAVNWLSRGAVLGGIYGRPVVAGNLALYFITAMVCARIAVQGGQPAMLVIGLVPSVLAIVYSRLLFGDTLQRERNPE